MAEDTAPAAVSGSLGLYPYGTTQQDRKQALLYDVRYMYLIKVEPCLYPFDYLKT